MKLSFVLQLVLKALTLVPAVVQGVEQIHGSAKSGAGKKDLALQSLLLASGVASAVDPSDTETISAVSGLVGHAIDSSVSLYNATGWNKPKPELTGTVSLSAPVSTPTGAVQSTVPVHVTELPPGA